MNEREPLSKKEQNNREWNNAKILRHMDNLQHLTGFYHGEYFQQPDEVIGESGTIYKNEKLPDENLGTRDHLIGD